MRKSLLAYAFIFVLCTGVFFLLKTSSTTQQNSQYLQFAKDNTEEIASLFQASFYFYYEDQFKPEIEKILQSNPQLERILIITLSGQVVFNSEDLRKNARTESYSADAFWTSDLRKTHLLESQGSFLKPRTKVAAALGQYIVGYEFANQKSDFKLALLCFGLFLLLSALVYSSKFYSIRKLWEKIQQVFSWTKLYSLRAKFILAIVLLNLVTGAIIFFSQSYLQKQEQVERLIRSSVNLAESNRDQVISNFSNYFYFYYQEKFIPFIQALLQTKENLVSIRIISKKSRMIVFDSTEMNGVQKPVPGVEGKSAQLTEAELIQLSQKDTYDSLDHLKSGEPMIRVLTTYRNELQDAPFLVEFVFSFASLQKKVQKIQAQILLNLIPSVLLGVLVAILFSQFIVAPVRRLVSATDTVAQGNYEVTLNVNRKDELGELMKSFNVMTEELRRKNELKKYLSEHSYRRIVEQGVTVSKISGTRVHVTVLFCDIRNFVEVCESLEAEEVTTLLNDYFSGMVEVIYKHKGEVDKFIGDAILAVFYEKEDTRSTNQTVLNAIYCAMEMRERLHQFNEHRAFQGKAVIEIGIGINTGEVISGPIGSPDRMDFTVIGDTVNLASRIEKLSKTGKHTRIVFSHHVEAFVKGILEYHELTREPIRGKLEEVIVYELVQIKEIDQLLQQLQSRDPATRRHCVQLLGFSRNEKVLHALLQHLHDDDPSVRIAVVGSIVKLVHQNHEHALDALFEQVHSEKDKRVISSILVAIGRLCTSERLLQVVRFLQHPDERIVANAIEALNNCDDPAVVDLLLSFLGSKNNRVKANAAMVLFSKGRIEVIDVLKPMLLSSDPLMRASAAFALGELTLISSPEKLVSHFKNDPERAKYVLAQIQSCVPLLISLLKDQSVIVRKQVIVALGKIKDRAAVLPLVDNLKINAGDESLTEETVEALRSIGSHRLVREFIQHI